MKITLTFLLTVLIYIAVNAQPKNVEEEVKQIGQTYKIINSSKLKSSSYKYSNNCGVVNATITVFFLDGEIVKIADNGFGDDDKAAAKWNYEYYFKEGDLIFSYKWVKSYNDELEKVLSTKNGNIINPISY